MEITRLNSSESSTTRIAHNDTSDIAHESNPLQYILDDGILRLAQAGWAIFDACTEFESKCSKLLDFATRKWRAMLGIRSKATWIKPVHTSLMDSDTLAENSLTAAEIEAAKIVNEQGYKLPTVCLEKEEPPPDPAKTLNILDSSIPSSFGFAKDVSIEREKMQAADPSLDEEDFSFQGMLSKLSFSLEYNQEEGDSAPKQDGEENLVFGQEFAGLLKDLSELEESQHDSDETSKPAALWIAQAHEEICEAENSVEARPRESDVVLKEEIPQSEILTSQTNNSHCSPPQIAPSQITSSQLALEQRLVFTSEPKFVSNELIEAEDGPEIESELEADEENRRAKPAPKKLSKSKFDVQIRLPAIEYQHLRSTLIEVLGRSHQDMRGRKPRAQQPVGFSLKPLRLLSWKDSSLIEPFCETEQTSCENLTQSTHTSKGLLEVISNTQTIRPDPFHGRDGREVSLPEQTEAGSLPPSSPIGQASSPRYDSRVGPQEESFPSIDDIIRAEHTIMQDTSLFSGRLLTSAAGTGQNKPGTADFGLFSEELSMDDISSNNSNCVDTDFGEKTEHSKTVFEEALLKYLEELHAQDYLEFFSCFAELPRPRAISQWQIADFIEALLHMAGKSITLCQDLADSPSAPIKIKLLSQDS